MSGLAVIFNRNRAPVAPDLVEGVLKRLAHRGSDGQALIVREHVGLAHRHFWVTPEDVGEDQPLIEAGRQAMIVFDGRLDNRRDLLDALQPDRGPYEDGLPDAALALRAYCEWGVECLAHLLGSFAFAVYDGLEQHVFLARDPLGDCTLFYYLDPRVLVVASEPYAVLAHPAPSPKLNETSVARFFAVQAPEGGASMFRDVSELLPAHAMVVGCQTARQWRYWDVPPDRSIRYRTDQDYAEHLRALLEDSVRCCLRSTSPPAVLMSGGADSTAVAAVAARELAAASPPGRLCTISWIFDELAECDERQYIEPVNRLYDAEVIYIPADDAWPLREWPTWPYNPNHPEGNAYRYLKTRAYDAARQAGLRTLLTGGFGNHLFTGAEYWLADLLHDRGLRGALVGLRPHVGRWGVVRVMAGPSVRRAIERLPLGAVLWRRQARTAHDAPPWLTPYARQVLEQSRDAATASGPGGPRPDQRESVLGTVAAYSYSAEVFHSSSMGLELRHPYRDRRLVEFMLAVPAYQLYDGRFFKPIVRNAMEGLLPEPVRMRQAPTSLAPLYRRGLLERETEVVSRIMGKPEAVWRKYVSADWLNQVAPSRLRSGVDGGDTVVLWQCVSMELWRDRQGALST